MAAANGGVAVLPAWCVTLPGQWVTLHGQCATILMMPDHIFSAWHCNLLVNIVDNHHILYIYVSSLVSAAP